MNRGNGGWTLGVAADSQNRPGDLAVGWDLLRAAAPDIAGYLHCGDAGYGTVADWALIKAAMVGRADWQWNNPNQPLPIAIFAPGNHDLTLPDGPTLWNSELTGQRAQQMPWLWDVRLCPLTVAGCLVFVADTDCVAAEANRQRARFATALRQAHRWGLWPILMFHYNVYMCTTFFQDRGSYTLPLIQELEDYVALYHPNGLPVFSGHGHNYECTHPLTLGVPAVGGNTFITVGQLAGNAHFAPDPGVWHTVHGAPSIARDDTYNTTDVLLAQDPDGTIPGIGRLDVIPLGRPGASLRWRYYQIIGGALSLYHEVTILA